MEQNTGFENGARWVRADFHLHTQADTEFPFPKETSRSFKKEYIAQLKKENIELAVITNHNKLDLSEFRSLRKQARQENIYLMAGVEYSLAEIGVHILIVFEESWFQNKENTNYVKQFLDQAHIGKTNYSSPDYPNSNYTLSQTVDALNKHERDYFIIMAHVDDKNGLFQQITGRNKTEFLNNSSFKERVVAFQKCSSKSKEYLESYLKTDMLACVEGTDNAQGGIEALGIKKEKVYLKLSDFNFDAVKYALTHHQDRVKAQIPHTENTYIKSITYQGGELDEKKRGKLDGKTIHLNANMNNLIGIRGGGKSSILETIRYALGIHLEDNISADKKYKKNIIGETFKSGFKITLEIVKNNKIYSIETIEKQQKGLAKVVEYPELKVNSLLKVQYFGQKDLSKIGENDLTSKEFIYRLIGKADAKQKIKSDDIAIKIKKLLADINQTTKRTANIPDVKSRITELEQNIENVDKFGLKAKLEKKITYNRDADRFEGIKSHINTKIEALSDFISEYSNTDYTHLTDYESKENQDAFDEVFNKIAAISKTLKSLEGKELEIKTYLEEIRKIETDFLYKKEQLESEFNQSQSETGSSVKDIDNYENYQRELDRKKLELAELGKLNTQKEKLNLSLHDKLRELQESWKKEHEIVKSKLDKINAQQKHLKLEIGFKENKEELNKYIFSLTKGIRQENIRRLTENHNDLIDMYFDYEQQSQQKKEVNQSKDFKEQFYANLVDFLTYRVPDVFDIKYNEKPLKKHSLGQRASAIIVFLLSLQENDLIIIDQPEDDLDSQTIYKEVISELKKLKNTTQFIFATHNPNIPVLGDCEQVIVCQYDNEKEEINVELGGIDKKEIQEKIIRIMEGGKDAFQERKNKYKQWTH